MAGPSVFVADPNVFLGGQTAPAHHLRRVMILAAAAASMEKKLAGYERLANKRPTGDRRGLDLRKLKGHTRRVVIRLIDQRGFDIPVRRPFFETLVQLIIGVLFIPISATVTPQSLRHLVLPTLGLVAVLVFVARPIAAFASTLGTDLKKGERAFIGWMAPRGIVATATASTFTAGRTADGRMRRWGSGYGAGITRCG